MLLAFDLDDVLAETMKELVLFHNDHYGTRHSFSDYTTYDHDQLWGCSREEADRRHVKFRSSSYFHRIVPVEMAVDAAKELRKKHGLVIISARPEDIRTATEEWLNLYFKGIFSKVHFTNQYDLTAQPRTKAQVCLKLGVDLMVDYALQHIDVCEAAGVPVILYDPPWNRNGREDYRVLNWVDLVRKIEQTELSRGRKPAKI